MEDELTLDGGNTVQCIDHVSWKCIPETYIILLTNVSQINLIKKKKKTYSYVSEKETLW